MQQDGQVMQRQRQKRSVTSGQHNDLRRVSKHWRPRCRQKLVCPSSRKRANSGIHPRSVERNHPRSVAQKWTERVAKPAFGCFHWVRSWWHQAHTRWDKIVRSRWCYWWCRCNLNCYIYIYMCVCNPTTCVVTMALFYSVPEHVE